MSSLRRLRALVAVARHEGIVRAADELHLTPSAVTRALRTLEAEWGLPLFDRTSRGLKATPFGARLTERAARAIGYLDEMRRRLGPGTPKALEGRLSNRQLQVVAAIADRRSETAAAAQLGVTQPAVTVALRDLEHLLGTALFLRSFKGMTPTPDGDIVVQGAKRVLNEMAAAAADLASHHGRLQGRLALGTLPLSGTHIPPGPLIGIAEAHPELQLSVIEGPYATLLEALVCGDIDVVVGALHPQPPAGVVQEHLFDDRLCVVARAGHPLAQRQRLVAADLRSCDWVLPFDRTPSRRNVEAALHGAGLEDPFDAIEANSVALVRMLLLKSDRLSVLSRRQIFYEEQGGLLKVLPLPTGPMSIGMMTRADALQTEATQLLIDALRRLGRAECAGAIPDRVVSGI